MSYKNKWSFQICKKQTKCKSAYNETVSHHPIRDLKYLANLENYRVSLGSDKKKSE